MADDQFQYVKLPDGSYGKFASSASDDDIKTAIQKDFPDAFTPTPTQQAANRVGYVPNTSMSAGTQTFDQAHPNATPKPPGIMSRFAAGAGIPTSQADTTQAVQGLLTPQADPNETNKLVRFGEQIPLIGSDLRAREDLSRRADAEGGGNMTGVAHRLASYLPLVGPAVTAAQDRFDQGDYAGAAGAGLSSLFAMEGLKGAITPKPNVLPTDQPIQQVAARKPFTPPAPMPKALPAGPIITPPPADTSGSVPYTPPPVAATTRAQRLGLMLPEKASGAIQLGPGELLPPDSPEGLFPAAPHFLVDKDGNPRVQFLTSAATDQVAAPNVAPDSAQSVFQNAPAKPGLLDGIRDHEFMSGVQDSLNGQAGDDHGQSFLDQWMQSHNQQAPGAKTGPGLVKGKSDAVLTNAIEKANASGQSVLPPDDAPAPAPKSPGLMNKAKKPAAQAAPPQPQIATPDNTEDLLRQSLLSKGIDPDVAQGGHAGGGVSSVEELNRPGTNYVVSKSGQLTYHGKSFAPESTPDGASHVTALPDGTYRVNAGPELNAAQTNALKAARPDIGLPLHSGPHPANADQAEINRLAQEMINAKNKKSGR